MTKPTLTEAQWQAQVVHLLRIGGFDIYHTHDSRRSTPGFPDIIAADRHRLFAWELKTDKGRASAAQKHWLALLEPFATDARVARPSDWDTLVQIVTGRPA